MKLTTYILTGLMPLVFFGCRPIYEAPVPYYIYRCARRGRFVAPVRQRMEGVYTVSVAEPGSLTSR